MKKYIIICNVFLLLVSCENTHHIIIPEKNMKIETTILVLSFGEYLKKYKKEIENHDEATYVGLTMGKLKLLCQNFKEATAFEEKNDIAYNKKSLKLNIKYLNIQQYLSKNKNILLISKHLNYSPNQVKDIVYKDKNAIISFLKREGSYESFLIFLDNTNIRIKLIDYLYT